jgi:hypothetical protein
MRMTTEHRPHRRLSPLTRFEDLESMPDVCTHRHDGCLETVVTRHGLSAGRGGENQGLARPRTGFISVKTVVLRIRF